MNVTFNPFASAVPTVSMSIVISASSAKDVSERTEAVAAVVVVFSELSKVGFVEKIVEPPSLTLMVMRLPADCATVSDALTEDSVIALGIRKVTFAVPVVIFVVSSDTAT